MQREKKMSEGKTEEQIKDAVRNAYGSIARRYSEELQQVKQVSCCGSSPAAGGSGQALRASCCGPSPAAATSGSCCGPSAAPEAEAPASRDGCCGSSEAGMTLTAADRFYAAEELGDLPESVTGASLGCGNPLAIAGLQPGEVVLDLGSGGGIDCFLAARRVGPAGRVIGLDMTPDMVKLARRNAKKLGVTNVDFRFGEMEEMPLPDESVDVIISNCVINLSPDKDTVFRQAYRVLRPGGRLSISDMVVDGDLPSFIRNRLDAWAGCIAGALDERVYLDKIRAAGFEDVEVVSREIGAAEGVCAPEDVQALLGVNGEQEVEDVLARAGLSPQKLMDRVASIKVVAYKPA